MGRGRGFRVSRRQSIINDPAYKDVNEKIAARGIEILRLLMRTGIVSSERVSEGLELTEEHEVEISVLKDRHQDELLSILAKQEEDHRSELGWLESEINDLLLLLGGSPFRYPDLPSKLGFLRDELEALRALQE